MPPLRGDPHRYRSNHPPQALRQRPAKDQGRGKEWGTAQGTNAKFKDGTLTPSSEVRVKVKIRRVWISDWGIWEWRGTISRDGNPVAYAGGERWIDVCNTLEDIWPRYAP